MVTKSIIYGLIVFVFYICISAIAGVHGVEKYHDRSRVLYASDGSILTYKLSSDDKVRFLSKAEKIDPLYLAMLKNSEDERFDYHPGVDPIAIIRSFITNIQGFELSGASTIAMQLAKMLDRKERNILSKIKEVVQACYLTLFYGRERVLDMYLTLAPFGSNIEGVTAASLMYFGHMPDRLAPDEAALLVALPRAPEKIRPDRNNKRASYYVNKVLLKAFAAGIISHDVLTAAQQRKIAGVKTYPEHKAYHLGVRAFSSSNDKELFCDIDSNVQNILNSVAQKFKTYASKDEILGIVVIDNRKNTLVGYLGSQDYKEHFVDFVKAKRSTGSLLKPFIYGIAFDRRLIMPHTLIDDCPKSFITWQPKNFTRDFKGKVSAARSLILSLNLPAINILKALGPKECLEILNADSSYLYMPDGPDLTLATGGSVSDLLSLSELYAILPSDGKLNSVALFYTKNKKRHKIKASDNFANSFKEDLYTNFYSDIRRKDESLLSKEASDSIYAILKEVKRAKGYESLSNISYKTGTSYNHIDAQAIGSLSNYTVAVRSGKDNGQSNEPHTGFSRAAPILFEIFSLLDIKDYPKLHTDYQGLIGSNALNELIFEDERDLFDTREQKLKIAFPIDKSVIMPIDKKVYLDIKGGTPPYRIYLNKKKTPYTSHVEIEGSGLFFINVCDDKGQNDEVTVYIPSKNL